MFDEKFRFGYCFLPGNASEKASIALLAKDQLSARKILSNATYSWRSLSVHQGAKRNARKEHRDRDTSNVEIKYSWLDTKIHPNFYRARCLGIAAMAKGKP
ncbi:hypothetical protein KM043_000548 [Ampulex compressa]|nr:hypothetical protein KM043_000548 [Ampulex compressa]